MASTKTQTNKIPVKAGDQVHFLRPSFNFSTKPNDLAGAFLVISERGQTITITDDLIQASLDREGNSWLELVDDLPAQARRWGEPAFARGEAPQGMENWTPGQVDHLLEFEYRKQVIRDSVRDPEELVLKMRELMSSPIAQGLPKFSNKTVYDGEAPKNGTAQNWDVN